MQRRVGEWSDQAKGLSLGQSFQCFPAPTMLKHTSSDCHGCRTAQPLMFNGPRREGRAWVCFNPEKKPPSTLRIFGQSAFLRTLRLWERPNSALPGEASLPSLLGPFKDPVLGRNHSVMGRLWNWLADRASGQDPAGVSRSILKGPAKSPGPLVGPGPESNWEFKARPSERAEILSRFNRSDLEFCLMACQGVSAVCPPGAGAADADLHESKHGCRATWLNLHVSVMIRISSVGTVRSACLVLAGAEVGVSPIPALCSLAEAVPRLQLHDRHAFPSTISAESLCAIWPISFEGNVQV